MKLGSRVISRRTRLAGTVKEVRKDGRITWVTDRGVTLVSAQRALYLLDA